MKKNLTSGKMKGKKARPVKKFTNVKKNNAIPGDPGSPGVLG